jgi:TonB-linked SusC/RagA family outer membrane protein
MKKIKLLFFPLLFLFCITVNAQTRTVKGKVTSSKDNQPVPGASVSVKGKGNSVVTGADGNFSLTVPNGNVIIVISSVGYVNVQKAIDANAADVVIELNENQQQLEGVVVTALGITRRTKSLVYAVQTVKTSELTEARDPNNVINSLQGKVAGAVITQGSGGPGSGARIVLRGNRSIQGTNNALIVVDGVPISNGTNGTPTSDFGAVQGSDGASSINPDDIESMTILRGASAAALYGSQAGNGVIVITTKKGKKDKISVTINSGVTTESVFALPEFQNSYGQGNNGVLKDTLLSGESWGARMNGQSVITHLLKPGTYSAQPDNVKDFFQKGYSLNNSIGVSGGTEKMQTYLSYTNNKISGIIQGNELIRHTVNLRLTNQISSRFSTDAKVTYLNQDIKNRPRTGEENAPVIDIYNMPRNISTADAKNYEALNNIGISTPTAFPSALSSIYQNPYWVVNRTSINETRDRVIGFITAKYKITNWLTLSGKANIDKTFDRGDNQVSQGTILWGNSGGDYAKQTITTTEKWFDAMLEGNNNIIKDLKVNYRLGTIYQDSKNDQNGQNAGGLNITNKFSLNFAKTPSVNSSFTQTQIQSVFAQTNFSFKDAIFLDASVRRDWDSRLPSPYIYTYPAIGVSAVISDLVKNLPKVLSFLKTSINYAQVGNGGRAQLLNSFYNYQQGAGAGFLVGNAVLPINLKPEIVKSLEFGIEARFLNNRIGFTANYYKSNSINQLLTIALPVASGYNSKYINAGDIQNKGFELVINGAPIRTKQFSWDVTFNFAANRNKILSLDPDIKKVPLGGGFNRSATPIVIEGQSYGDLVALKWATDAKGNRIVDAFGKPVLTKDEEYIGNFNPKATIGFTNTFEYKGIYLRLLVDGRVGGTIVSGTEMNLAFSGIPKVTEQFREGGLNLGGVNASGTPVTATIKAQDFWQIASGKRYGAGEFFAYNGTNFRVRELSLGYTIPAIKALSFIQSIKLSFVARNLFWLYRGKSSLNIPGIGTRKMWFDPDMSLGNANWQGVEYGTLPATRSFGVNLQVTF